MKKRVNKKGLSIMIGYVLLISAAIFMSFIVYAWMKSYVPKETPECPSDVSILITKAECSNNKIIIDIKNTGLFSIEGYTLSGRETDSGEIVDLSAGFYTFQTPCAPGENHFGDGLPAEAGTNQKTIDRIELIPIRIETSDEGQKKTAICGDAKISRAIDVCNLLVSS